MGKNLLDTSVSDSTYYSANVDQIEAIPSYQKKAERLTAARNLLASGVFWFVLEVHNSTKTIEGVSFEAYTLYCYIIMIRLFLFVFTPFLYPCLYYFRNNHKLVEACHNTINKACNTVSYFSIHKVGFEETPERTEE